MPLGYAVRMEPSAASDPVFTRAVLVPELLPRAVRTTGFALIYAVGVCVFGGSTQVVLTWLIGMTGDPISPAYYLMLANAISVAAIWLLEESKGRPLD